MPWTFAHPAAVLVLRPLTPSRLSFAALVIGALTPDMGYYVACFDFATRAHTLSGWPLGCLPIGFALLWLLRTLRRPLCHLLPQPHRHALQTLPPVPLWDAWGQAGKVALSLLLGALTHIAWDAFTHASGVGVARWPMLQQPLQFPFGGSLSLFGMLQHGSTVVGVIALGVAYSRWLKRTPKSPSPAPERWRYGLLAGLVLAALLCAAPVAYGVALSISSTQASFFHVFVVRWVMLTTSAFALLFIGTALVVDRKACPQASS